MIAAAGVGVVGALYMLYRKRQQPAAGVKGTSPASTATKTSRLKST